MYLTDFEEFFLAAQKLLLESPRVRRSAPSHPPTSLGLAIVTIYFVLKRILWIRNHRIVRCGPRLAHREPVFAPFARPRATVTVVRSLQRINPCSLITSFSSS